jgi:hypothetical protein
MVMAALLVPGTGLLTPPPAQAATATLHYTANEEGDYATPHSLGYNLHDTGPTQELIDSLPGGDRAVVWLGEKCPTGLSSGFVSAVTSLGQDSRVFAYYLSDEPHAAGCPNGAANLAAEADYIHAHTSGQLAFIVLLDTGADYATFAPGNTHVDAVGLDPYPCNVKLGGCNLQHIDDQVGAAEAAGISANAIVPTFQVFGNSYYLMPSPAQLQSMLDEWAKLVPHPVFDYSYSWGCQSGSLSSCLATSPGDQQVMAAHNGATAPPPSTTTPPSVPATTAARKVSPISRPPTTPPTTAPPTTAASPASTTTDAVASTTATTDPTGSPLNHTHAPHAQARPLHPAKKHHRTPEWSDPKRYVLALLLLVP